MFSEPWSGETKIMVGIDIGATQSGVALAFLQQGDENLENVIHHVTGWPGQESQSQSSRVPTLVWYDENKTAVSFGAEAQLATTEDEAEESGWFLAKQFKLHLYPGQMRTRNNMKLDDLPLGVSLQQIYSDFLKYILSYTMKFFQKRIVDGSRIWEQYSPTMEIVLTHPGFGIREQAFLRSATVAAGWTTADQASRNIRFVTEAEASVHFCIRYSNIGDSLQWGTKFAVCDAGGSTFHTMFYSVASAPPIIRLEEQASICVQTGATLVNLELEKFLQDSLANIGLSGSDVTEYIKTGVKDFESSGKRLFAGQNIRIALAHHRFNNPAIEVRRGHMTLSGPTIKGFFDVCVKEITANIDQQLGNLNVLVCPLPRPFSSSWVDLPVVNRWTQGLSISHILLVGGFADSLYLRAELNTRYKAQGYQVVLVNNSSSLAAAEGALLWRTLQCVIRRMPRSSWGIETLVAFDRDDTSHQGRTLEPSTLGWMVVPGRWNCLVKKGVVINVDTVVRIPFFLEFSTPSPKPDKFELELYNYSGDDEPVWMRDEKGKLLQGFCHAAHLQANLECLYGALESRISAGAQYWTLQFEVCIRFGGTELEAYLEWEENVGIDGTYMHMIQLTSEIRLAMQSNMPLYSNACIRRDIIQDKSLQATGTQK